MNERLDETIDRVAAELTAMPPDPGCSMRVRDRLSSSPRRRPMWLAASAAAAAVIAVVVIARFAAAPPADATVASALDSRSVSIGLAMLPPSAQREQRASTTDGTGEPLVLVREPGVTRAEPIAPSPDDLKIDPLVVEAIEVPAVAVIVPLDVPHLEIGDIAAGEVAKEPK